MAKKRRKAARTLSPAAKKKIRLKVEKTLGQLKEMTAAVKELHGQLKAVNFIGGATMGARKGRRAR